MFCFQGIIKCFKKPIHVHLSTCLHVIFADSINLISNITDQIKKPFKFSFKGLLEND